jgi:hypothetical protein
MQAPPPYYAAGPKKSKVGLIIAIVVGVIAICCVLPSVGLGFFGYKMFGKAQGFVGCGWALNQMRDGIIAYAKDHKDALPAKATWEDDIQPYLKALPRNSGLKLPPANSGVCDMDAKSGFTYNAELAGKKISSIKDQGTTIILWEVNHQGRNQSDSYKTPDYATGPPLVGNVPRGWIVQPLAGAAYWMDQQGSQTPIPIPGDRVNVNVEDRNGRVDVKTSNGEVHKNGGVVEIKTTGG